MRILWIFVKGVIGFVGIILGGIFIVGFVSGVARGAIPNFPTSQFEGLSMIILTIAAIVLTIIYLRRQIKKS